MEPVTIVAFLVLLLPPPECEVRLSAIECNVFGEPGSERAALLFRDFDGEIRAWVWHDPKHHKPIRTPRGWLMWWEYQGQFIAVLAKECYSTRTLEDVEVKERERLPVEKRRKLK